MKVSQLKKNPNNPRQIRDSKFELLKKSIEDFPAMMELRPIIVDETMTVLGGNMRLSAIKALGMKEIPDAWIKRADELTDAQKKEFVIKDNNSFGEYDWDLLNQGDWTDFPLSDWGLDLPEFEAAEDLPEEDEENNNAEAQLNRAQEWKEKHGVELNQIWQIGKHRLLIGDCTNKELFEKLMDGKTADLLHTDPPYGISIVSVKNTASTGKAGGSKAFGSSGATSGSASPSTTGFDSRRKVGRTDTADFAAVQKGQKIIQSNIYPIIEGDDKPFEPSFLLDLAPIVVLWGANYFADKLPPSSNWIVWDKRENITRNTFADCEMAWCSEKGNARIFYHLWNGLHKGSQHGERRVHPTEKPVALFEEIGKKHADGGLWLDLYAGSGAQIVAAEKSGATCYAAEIEPLYGATIIERLTALGLEAKII